MHKTTLLFPVQHTQIDLREMNISFVKPKVEKHLYADDDYKTARYEEIMSDGWREAVEHIAHVNKVPELSTRHVEYTADEIIEHTKKMAEDDAEHATYNLLEFLTYGKFEPETVCDMLLQRLVEVMGQYQPEIVLSFVRDKAGGQLPTLKILHKNKDPQEQDYIAFLHHYAKGYIEYLVLGNDTLSRVESRIHYMIPRINLARMEQDIMRLQQHYSS